MRGRTEVGLDLQDGQDWGTGWPGTFLSLSSFSYSFSFRGSKLGGRKRERCRRGG